MSDYTPEELEERLMNTGRMLANGFYAQVLHLPSKSGPPEWDALMDKTLSDIDHLVDEMFVDEVDPLAPQAALVMKTIIRDGFYSHLGSTILAVTEVEGRA